jgi:hypothetical protein
MHKQVPVCKNRIAAGLLAKAATVSRDKKMTKMRI